MRRVGTGACVDLRVALLVVVGFGVVLSGCSSTSAPSRMPLGFSEEREFSDHREVDLVWESAADDARLSGSLYLPLDPGPHAVMVLHHGSHRWTREPWNLLYSLYLGHGIAVFSYDKRGVGESEGECCPFRDKGYFELLAGDLIGAARALQDHDAIDPDRVGVYGFSQGGWVAPIAAAEAPDAFALAHIGSGPAVTLGEELLYSKLTGDAACTPSGLSDEEIEAELDAAGPSLFDPVPYIESMPQPGLWQYCEDDTSIPVERSINILEGLRETDGLEATIQLFGNCNHQFVRGGGMCEGEGVRTDWWTPLFSWLEAKGFARRAAAP